MFVCMCIYIYIYIHTYIHQSITAGPVPLHRLCRSVALQARGADPPFGKHRKKVIVPAEMKICFFLDSVSLCSRHQSLQGDLRKRARLEGTRILRDMLAIFYPPSEINSGRFGAFLQARKGNTIFTELVERAEYGNWERGTPCGGDV